MKSAMLGLLAVCVAGSAKAQVAPARPASAPQGSATVDTTILPPQEIGSIQVGQTRYGMLELGDYTMGDGTYADVWYLNLNAGQRVTVELVSTQFDAYEQFLDPWGGKLAEDDDSGGHNNSRLSFTVREAGRYQIVVNNSGDVQKTGRYTLTVR